MNECDWKKLSPLVRDAFARIPDNAFDNTPQIAAWREEISALRAAERQANERHDAVRAILGGLQEQIGKSNAAICDIDARRMEIVATALVDGGGFAEDDALIVRRREVERHIERLTLAQPALERMQRSRHHELGVVTSKRTRIEDQIRDLIDAMKLESARNKG